MSLFLQLDTRFDSWQTEAQKEPYRCAVYIHIYLSGSVDASDRGSGSIQLFSHSKKIVLRLWIVMSCWGNCNRCFYSTLFCECPKSNHFFNL